MQSIAEILSQELKQKQEYVENVREKGLATCADCGQMDGCLTLGCIAANSPFVLENLKQLRQKP